MADDKSEKKDSVYRRAKGWFSSQGNRGKQRPPIIAFFLFLICYAIHVWSISSVSLYQSMFMYFILSLPFALLYKEEGEPWFVSLLVYFWLALLGLAIQFGVLFILNSFPMLGNFDIAGQSALWLFKAIILIIPFPIIALFSRAGTWIKSAMWGWVALLLILGMLYFFSTSFSTSFLGQQVITVDTGPGIDLMKGTVAQAGVMASDAFRNLIGAGRSVAGTLNGSVNRLMDPVFYGTVENNKKEKLGVYINTLEPATDPILPEDENIVVYAPIVAKTFTGEINLKNTCYAKYHKNESGQRSKTLTLYAGTVDLPELDIHDLEENTLACTIPRQPIETMDTSLIVIFNASFNFNTWGYIDYAFMDRGELRNRQSSGKDVAREIGLKSSTVSAVYTNGPITLGLVRQTDPPKLPWGIDPAKPVLPLFGVTIENSPYYKGRGQIQRINRLVFHIPEQITIPKDSCTPVTYAGDPIKDPNNPYTLYTFENVPVRRDADYQTIRCRLNLEPSEVKDFLGEGGIALATFAVEADYDYELTEDITIKIDSGT